MSAGAQFHLRTIVSIAFMAYSSILYIGFFLCSNFFIHVFGDARALMPYVLASTLLLLRHWAKGEARIRNDSTFKCCLALALILGINTYFSGTRTDSWRAIKPFFLIAAPLIWNIMLWMVFRHDNYGTIGSERHGSSKSGSTSKSVA